MKYAILIGHIILFSLVSCVYEDPILDTVEAEHTLFIYLPWSTNLTDDFRRNINDFGTAIKQDILGNNKVMVFFMTSDSEAAMFELKYSKGDCVRDTLKRYTHPAFTTVEGISGIISDMRTFAPARRYSMIVGAHGSAWIPVNYSSLRSREHKYHWEYDNVPATRFFGGLSKEHQTDIATLAEAIASAGIKMDYILFDDCYMASVEVAYTLRRATKYLIGCPTEVMAYGYPYSEIAQHLIGNFDLDGITEGFITFYQNYYLMPCGTISVTDCTELDSLAVIMKNINERFTIRDEDISSIQKMCGYTPTIFFDLGDYVSKFCADSALLAGFNDQMSRAVPLQYRRHTDYYYSQNMGKIFINAYSGITTSDPSFNTITSSKTETDWYKATH